MSNEDPRDLPDAKERVTEALNQYQANYRRVMALDTTTTDRNQSVINMIRFFSFAVLLETIRRTDVEQANALGDWLDSMLEDNGAGEWVAEWQMQLAAGRPIELPDLEVER
jgi:hypothetical protein